MTDVYRDGASLAKGSIYVASLRLIVWNEKRKGRTNGGC